MKFYTILYVVIVSTFISSCVFSDDFQSYHLLKESGSGISSHDVKYEEKIITQVKNSKSLVESQPDIFFEEPVYNFGKVYKNVDVEHFFMFENRGTEDLIIENIKASCGCIVSEATTSKVLPGMSEGIVAILKGIPDTGAISKNIKISMPRSRARCASASGNAEPPITTFQRLRSTSLASVSLSNMCRIVGTQ